MSERKTLKPQSQRKSLPQAFKPGNTAAGFGNQNAKQIPINRRTQKAFSNEIDRQLNKAYEGKDGKKLGRTIDALVKRLIDIGMTGDDKDSVRAITELMNRMEGKPMQAVEHSMNPDRPLEMVHRTMSPAEAARNYQKLLRRD